MKRAFFFLTFILIYTVNFAQTIVVSGKISDTQGKAVPFAFITDKQTQEATYSDSTGVFQIKTGPASTLLVTCNGYKNASVNVENKNSINVILSATDNSAGANLSANSDKTSMALGTPYVVIENTNGYIKTKEYVGETQGSRYLFNDWVHGYVTDQKNIIHQDSHGLYNYDKIDGKLLMTQDKTTVIEILKDQIKTFTLFDQNAHSYTFENAPDVDSKLYVEQLSAGKNYKIYKKLGTVLEKANYKTNGLSSSGHNYDLFIDKSTYYVVKNPAPDLIKIELRKKSIKNTFADQGDKLDKFMSEHAKKDIDDNYLKELGDYLNK